MSPKAVLTNLTSRRSPDTIYPMSESSGVSASTTDSGGDAVEGEGKGRALRCARGRLLDIAASHRPRMPHIACLTKAIYPDGTETLPDKKSAL